MPILLAALLDWRLFACARLLARIRATRGFGAPYGMAILLRSPDGLGAHAGKNVCAPLWAFRRVLLWARMCACVGCVHVLAVCMCACVHVLDIACACVHVLDIRHSLPSLWSPREGPMNVHCLVALFGRST